MKTHAVPIAALALCGFLLLEGCGSSSPRFGDREKKPEKKTTERKGPRFSSKEVEEETKENTKKVEPGEIDNIKSGARDFKKEKNPAIK
ncbi:MAG TPA: hypothetical protein VMM37_06315, partial [Bacteroidota bacterium]|nr:hypothetical protein [Bacteroidota bacterium]